MDANIVRFEPHKEIHILVVAFNNPSRSVLEKTLLSCNYQVTVTDDEKKAWSLLIERKNSTFDMAMIDVSQYLADGFNLTRIAASMDIFTIYISDSRDDGFFRIARSYGAELFMVKSFGLGTAKYLWQHLLPRKYMILPEQQHMDKSNIVKFDPHTEQIHILLVDADAGSLGLLQELLQRCNYKVTVSGDAKKASSLLKNVKRDFDIAIVDVDRQETEGLEFIEEATDIGIFTIHISAAHKLQNGTLVEEGQCHGAKLFLLKPVTLGTARYLWQYVSKMKNSTHNVRGIRDL